MFIVGFMMSLSRELIVRVVVSTDRYNVVVDIQIFKIRRRGYHYLFRESFNDVVVLSVTTSD